LTLGKDSINQLNMSYQDDRSDTIFEHRKKKEQTSRKTMLTLFNCCSHGSSYGVDGKDSKNLKNGKNY